MSEKEWMTQHWTTGDLNALVKNLGEKVARKIQRGEGKVRFEDVVKVLFDKRGRRIPENLSANVCDADRNFQLFQPELEQYVHYANRIMRLHGCLSVDAGVTAQQFKTETERLLALIRDNPQIVDIANGVWLPVVLPQLTTDDLGTTLEQYLKGVGKSYAKTFGDSKFYNHRKGTLAGKVNIFPGSRHDQLIERMKQGPVMGIHFPSPLQGFSINTGREQMSTLPKGFFLSGMDTSIAMVMYPDVLARDWNTPGLFLAAFSWQTTDSSLSFRADVASLDFDISGRLSGSCGGYSGGLLFLG